MYLLLFPLYASNFLAGTAGAVGLTVILLVFFYYFAVILLIGAEINAFFAEGVRPIPNDLASFVSTMAGRLNEDIPQDESEARVDTKPTELSDKEHTVDYVIETEEPDVPERVSQDPEIQAEVLKRHRRQDGNAQTQQQKVPSSDQKTRQTHRSQAVQSASPKSVERGAVVGAIIGAVLVFLVDFLRLRHR
jgi:preprotein translocase subunit SecF